MGSKVYIILSDIRLREEISKTLSDNECIFPLEAEELFEITFGRNDLIILHLQSIKESPLTFIDYLLNDKLNVKFFVLTDKPDLLEGTRLVQKGVKGYGNVFMTPAILSQAVSVILSGNIWLYPELSLFIISQAQIREDITSLIQQFSIREQEIILLVCKGYSNKKIAQIQNLSEISIKKALTQIYQQLGVHDRMEMVSKLR